MQSDMRRGAPALMPIQRKAPAHTRPSGTMKPIWHRAAGRVQAQVRAHRARRKGTGSGRHAQAQVGPGMRPRAGYCTGTGAGSVYRARTVPAGWQPCEPQLSSSNMRTALQLDASHLKTSATLTLPMRHPACAPLICQKNKRYASSRLPAGAKRCCPTQERASDA